ncbi:hypothetical protein [Krasilnikovia sp. MM14-A1259]|uniref:hypothetical protein n=1 Tax=Krasilnikovia sp. MM14-A1259 TaxID=3373539 RepID=UPI0037F8209D
MSAAVERRYASLLRLYPAEYRRARGAEVLDTLMASVEDGRARPAPREVGALILGALRAHAARGRRRDVRESWAAAARAAALMMLVYPSAFTAANTVDNVVHGGPGLGSIMEFDAPNLAAAVLGLYATIAALRGRNLSAAAAATAAFLATTAVAWSLHGVTLGVFWQYPLAIVLLLVVHRRRPSPPSGLLRYAPLVPLLLVLADQLFPLASPDHYGMLAAGLFYGVCVASLFWLAVDERVAMAMGLLVVNGFLIELAFVVESGLVRDPVSAVTSVSVSAVGPAILLASSAAVGRRHARL